ncbi:molybdopterin molybdotransferase MoeA [Umezakia ovalisporum]|jgi:molybdopterin molybdotransferase|uniref:Molybdopterin molybdenumtransferase n=2 Tax=Umezakia ovalisporum TaxID=75695 RepID=A0AA43KDT5_9CYAN|nr:gephyrin-like molybdotransferase Glp [Umezakia ovalisporum]MBI1242906.1 molybdopterin molybdenumtransferase MoeA [Nostoc sp. RI_552]MDH6056754.1 molybdopterin molybdotransferase MoeA [Umezakia ovalisporum FSS-43]MDH6062685.1 molybdopterin molybdotransferase MoeA [Umezakia ovalisporum FSS-62]MDH6066074.1 molybdopterin molybdotransferase MoeA [Umezakia ovalisporum APH033B]MDH6072169.1 molybdopterin molybdotransferase MoeA [Umezakia ovalisporum CobakiLakeA]
MLSVRDAEAMILNLVQPLNLQRDTETIDLSAAHSRILAGAVSSELDFPHWDNSAMDGYAVRYEDVQHSSHVQPTSLEIIAEIPAGYQPHCTVKPGQAARIFTGAVMPRGADTVVMQEKTRREEKRVLILAAPQPQEFVRHKAAFYQARQQLLPTGVKLNPPEIAVLAAAQCTKLNVYRRPRVAIFSSGDELVTPDQLLQPGQIVDSNQYALAALVREAGAEPLLLGIVKDHPDALREVMAYALANADIVLSSGGVSVGDYDYIEQILGSPWEIHIRSVAISPGKPLTVATFPSPQSPMYFGLPGNPVSAMVTFWRFVQPAIRKLSGLAGGWQPVFLKARSRDELKSNGNRETYFWGNLHLIDGGYEFDKARGSHSSGNLINLAQTNALGMVPVGTTRIFPQAEVQVLSVSFT